jgi:hypothetical protein
MENDFCDWWGFAQHGSSLDKQLKEKTLPGAEVYWCENEEQQTISIDYIRCIKLSDITIKPIWNPARAESIRKWGNADTLRTLPYYHDKVNNVNVVDPERLPRVTRKIQLNDTNASKFIIADGIHRINVAKELGLDCILCSVNETFVIKKSDIGEYHPKQSIKDRKA